jgi:leader peptidase (prepilin peptidase)/N-methyltransferase
LGAIIGSFAATLILRWLNGRSVATGRSACDHCQAPLSIIDLIPLFGYVIRRGRCRRCAGRIDPLHPLVELIAGLLGASALVLRPDLGGLALALLLWQLLILAILDGRALWLPDPLTATLALTGLALGGLVSGLPIIDRIIGGAAGFSSLAAIALAYRRFTGREGLGGGDPKLFGAIGLWLGWQALPLVLLFAGMSGVLLSLRFIGRSDWRTIPVAFGTLLAIAAGVQAVLMAGGWVWAIRLSAP